MKRAIIGAIVLHCAVFGQSAETLPTFDIADVQVSPKSTSQFQFMRTAAVRGGRYEIKMSTMVDLIRVAYGYDADKILGGPSWLELDRFDITAKVPADFTPETQKQMLQSLLRERFNLVLHRESKPLLTYALTAGKKPQLKAAEGSEQTGCKPQTSSGNGPGPEGGARITMFNSDGPGVGITLGPGMTIQYQCRNVTMEQFAAGTRGMMGANVGTNPLLDETGLKGAWNFDLKYSVQMNGGMMGNTGDRISFADAVDKQLGLKLEGKQVPTPVIVVEKCNRKPSQNPPGVAEALPPIPVPTEFEVASIKPADPNVRMQRMTSQPGGRVIIDGMPLRFLVGRAFNTMNNEQIVDLPKFAETERYDITAKAPSMGPASAQLDPEAMAPMMRALLVERFKLKYHTEDRPVTAYSLVAAKPKMKKADPESRTSCKSPNAPPGAPPGTRVIVCQNTTMEQFAEQLRSPELVWPVQDATGIEGGWDFTLTYNMRAAMTMGGGRGGPMGDAAPAAGELPSASDPTGGYTLLEAVEKELGLKLEKQKRSAAVIVIDHLEPKPTEN